MEFDTFRLDIGLYVQQLDSHSRSRFLFKVL